MKSLIYTLFYCFSLVTSAHAMLSSAGSHLPPSRVLTLQEIAFNTIAKEKVYSYLSRPTASELAKTDAFLSCIPKDLLTGITSTQPKNISLAHMGLLKSITNLVECHDTTKVVMSSVCGALIGMDVVTEESIKR